MGEASRGAHAVRPTGHLHAHARAKPPHDLGQVLSRVRHAGNETLWVGDLRAALQTTGAFASVRAQTVPWTVTTSLARLVEQATHYHYSTFRQYSDDALRTAIDTFRQRVRQAFPNATRITHDNDHVLVMAQRATGDHDEGAEAANAPRDCGICTGGPRDDEV